MRVLVDTNVLISAALSSKTRAVTRLMSRR